MNNFFSSGDNLVKKNLRITLPILIFLLIMITILLPLPYVEGYISPVFWIYETNLLNVPALVTFIFLMLVSLTFSFFVYKACKIPTLSDLESLIGKLNHELPIAVSNSYLKSIEEIRKLGKEESKLKQMVLKDTINNEINSELEKHKLLIQKLIEDNENLKKNNSILSKKANEYDEILEKVHLENDSKK